MNDAAAAPLSTSALAKRLKLPIQQLFATLRDYGWIDRQGDGWVLTAKGELHGGGYLNSQRYGRYIVWPEALAEHPMIVAIESDQRINSGAIRRYYHQLSTLQINQALCELGIQKLTRRGIELTDLGRRFGGRQEQDEDTGLAAVSWPHELVDHPVIHRELGRRQADGHRGLERETAAAKESEGAGDGATADLFSASAAVAPEDDRCGVDGHKVASLLQLRVCDWLYGAQLAHATQRSLPCEESLSADFFVPAAGLYIECWERDVPTAELSRRLRTREVCREMKLAYLEVAADDIERLDELLGAKLRECGALD